MHIRSGGNHESIVIGFCAFALVLCSFEGVAQADRAGSWEMGATLLDLSSVDVSGSNGATLSVDDETGYGISGAYNFTEKLALGLDVSYSDPAYLATLVPDGPGAPAAVSGKLGVDVIHFKGIYNILEGSITPFIEVGAGWTYVDSNIIEGYEGTFCWWDPWWGYVCEDYYDTYTETRSSVSYAIGLRWEIDSSFVLRASWGKTEIDTNRASEDIELDTIQMTFGWRF